VQVGPDQPPSGVNHDNLVMHPERLIAPEKF
jgi:hypothetical protein